MAYIGSISLHALFPITDVRLTCKITAYTFQNSLSCARLSNIKSTSGLEQFAQACVESQHEEQANMKLLYLHEEVSHWLCQPASMSLKREQLHPLKNHITSCAKCCVTEGRGETTLSQHYTKTYPVKALERHAQLHLYIMLTAGPCNQQALPRVAHNTTASLWLYSTFSKDNAQKLVTIEHLKLILMLMHICSL